MSNNIIMVVDDSIENLNFMKTILSRAHYQTRLAPSGMLALRALNSYVPDLILLDINMPDMNGYEVCRKIREDPRLASLPILFVSGMSGDEAEKVALAGGTGLIAKPFGVQELLRKISEVLPKAIPQPDC